MFFSHSDRAFSSALAITSLLEVYTEKIQGSKKLKFTYDTPKEVKEIIENGINYLSVLMDNEETPLKNTFFSGSVKGDYDLPFWYPANDVYFLNKKSGEVTPINPRSPKK